MKTINSIFLGLLALMFVTACSKDGADPVPQLGKDEVWVDFNLDASDIALEMTPMSRTYGPSYTKDGFKIRAFRKSLTGSNYLYYKDIDVTNFAFANNKLTGKQVLLVGSYKFLITYGESTTQLTMPTFTASTTLSEAAKITCTYSNQGLASELFLQTRHQKAVSPTAAGSLKEYEFKVGGETPNDPVAEKLQRAVARIDVLFLSGVKNGSTYTERAFVAPAGNTGKNILDNRALKLTFDIDRLSHEMSLIGTPSEGAVVKKPTSAVVLNYKNAGAYTNSAKVTIGESASATEVGKSTYLTYDNVLPAHIRNKAAHVFGTYFFPFITNDTPSARTTTDLNLTIEGSKSATDVVSRTVAVSKVPLEQNKVTLIILYVLGEDPGTSVFETNVNFAVEIVTDWLPSHNVEVGVD